MPEIVLQEEEPGSSADWAQPEAGHWGELIMRSRGGVCWRTRTGMCDTVHSHLNIQPPFVCNKFLHLRLI